MLRTLLVGLDGSAHSRSAVDLALAWASEHGAMPVGICVVDEPTIRQPTAMPIGGAYFKHQAEEGQLHDARRQLDQFLEQFTLRCTSAGLPFKLLEDYGDPATQIALEAQRFDLIVLGTKTWFHFETQEGPDDTLERVLRNGPRPVVAVPENTAPGESVMIAYDGSLPAARALAAFRATGLCRGLPVHVVSVQQDQVECARCADRAVEFLASHEIIATPHAIVTRSNLAEVLLDQARALKAGLLVAGAYGKPTLREFFLGSVTQSLLAHSPAPLFLYH